MPQGHLLRVWWPDASFHLALLLRLGTDFYNRRAWRKMWASASELVLALFNHRRKSAIGTKLFFWLGFHALKKSPWKLVSIGVSCVEAIVTQKHSHELKQFTNYVKSVNDGFWSDFGSPNTNHMWLVPLTHIHKYVRQLSDSIQRVCWNRPWLTTGSCIEFLRRHHKLNQPAMMFFAVLVKFFVRHNWLKHPLWSWLTTPEGSF